MTRQAPTRRAPESATGPACRPLPSAPSRPLTKGAFRPCRSELSAASPGQVQEWPFQAMMRVLELPEDGKVWPTAHPFLALANPSPLSWPAVAGLVTRLQACPLQRRTSVWNLLPEKELPAAHPVPPGANATA